MRQYSFTADQKAALIVAAYYFLDHVEAHPKRNSLKNALTKLRKQPEKGVTQKYLNDLHPLDPRD
jgi:hypothetical protein